MKIHVAIAVVLAAAAASFGAVLVGFGGVTQTVPHGTAAVSFTISTNESAKLTALSLDFASDTFGVGVSNSTTAGSLEWTWSAAVTGPTTMLPSQDDWGSQQNPPINSGIDPVTFATPYAYDEYVDAYTTSSTTSTYPAADATIGKLTLGTANLMPGTYTVVVDYGNDGVSAIGTSLGSTTNIMGEVATIVITPPAGSPVIATIGDDTISAPNAYTATPSLTQGTLITWTLDAAPAGMTIDSHTGIVSWPTSTTVGSPHTITIRATNNDGYATQTWHLTVTPAVAPIINTILDASIQAPSAYTGPTPTPSLTQGTPVVTWSLVEGPSGMTIDSATGVVSWPTSTATGSPHTITIKAENTAGSATQTWLLTVTPAPVLPVIPVIDDVTIQAPDSYTGPTPSLPPDTLSVTWSLLSGPPGMVIDIATGRVFWGVSDATGSPYTITIQATNGAGSATRSWQMTVLPAFAPIIKTIADQTIDTASAYTETPELQQGTPTITWSLDAGPSTMVIDTDTGLVSWPHPIVSDIPYTITIRATNSTGTATQTWQLTVTVPQVPPVIRAIGDGSVQAPNAYTGPTPFLMQGTPPVAWSLVTYPAGMTIDPDTGVVSWPTSTTTGSPHTITIKATNVYGSATATWQLTVTPAPVAPVIAAISDASVLAPNAYTSPVPSLTQGTRPVTWSLVEGPAGMTIDSSTGRVSWATSTTTDSPYTITIKAENSVGSATQTWHLAVLSTPVTPTIAIIPNDSIQVGDAYTGPTPSLTEGTQPVTWALVSGPSGMTIDPDTGVVSWSASSTEGSPWTITIEATNSAGSAVQSWDLTVTPKGIITPDFSKCGKGGSENLPALGMICLLSLMLGKRFVPARR